MEKYNFLSNEEITVLNLRSIYEKNGYHKFTPNQFESYDFYAKNKDFLVGNRILTFTDLNGKLMALKPDITLSIIKNAGKNSSALSGNERLYYTENVYRESKDINEFKEIFQVGIENIGKIDIDETFDTVKLALQSLFEIDKNSKLEISHNAYVDSLLNFISEDSNVKEEILNLISHKNIHDFKKLIIEKNLPEKYCDILISLLSPGKTNEEILSFIKENALNNEMTDSADELSKLYSKAKENGLRDYIVIDFSLVKDPSYYNGIIFDGYINNVPRNVLSGGRYDALLKKMEKKHKQAIGFAIYFDIIERLLASEPRREA